MSDIWELLPASQVRLVGDDPDAPPPVTVSMVGSHLVIRPAEQLSCPATRELVDALHAAQGAAPIVVIDLHGTDPEWPRTGRSPIDESDARWHENAMGVAAAVSVVGAGIVGIPASGALWTIDLVSRRFFRSRTVFDPRFVPSNSWTPIRGVWLSAAMVSVLTADGLFITSPRVEHDSDEMGERRHAS